MILIKIYARIRSLFLSKKYGFRGRGIKFGKNISIHNSHFISIGNNVFLDDNTELYVRQSITGITPQLRNWKSCSIWKVQSYRLR